MVAHLIDAAVSEGRSAPAVQSVLPRLEGAYALQQNREAPDTIVTDKGAHSLWVGIENCGLRHTRAEVCNGYVYLPRGW